MSDAEPQRIWPIGLYAPGTYWCKCAKCNQSHLADKRAQHCADCTIQDLAAEVTRLTAERDAARAKLTGDGWISALTELDAQKDAAYLERNQLVALLASIFPAGIKRTAIEGWSEDWHGCVYIDFPWGQASWHYHDSQAALFAYLPPYAGEWDGHTTEAKYDAIVAASRSGGSALADARAQGVADGLRMAAEAIWHDPIARLMKVRIRQEVANHLLALIQSRDKPRPASGPIDPTQGFATTGAEAQWIADTEAGVYDNAPCPDCGRELLATGDHVYCPHCPARPIPPAPPVAHAGPDAGGNDGGE